MVITENQIELLKPKLTGKYESELIDFSEIKSIIWNQGGYC